MRIALMLLLVALPLIEIGVLIKVGGWLGFWPTLGIVVLTGALGIAVIMEHGLTAAIRLQRAMLAGETPLLTMLDGALLVAAGILLVTPGLIADVVGLLLLVPPVRRLAARALGRWLLLLDPGAVRPDAADGPRAGGRDSRPGGGGHDGPRHRGEGPRPRPSGNGGAGPVIDGEYRRLDERTVDPNERPNDRPGNDRR